MTTPRALGLSVVALVACLLAADDPPPPKLSMTTAVACSKITGYDDFVALEDVVLTKDDKLLVYFEPEGYKYETVGKEYRVHFTQDARIRRRGQKKVIQAKDKILDYKGASKQPPLNVYLANTISLKNLAPGDYDLEIILRDEVGKAAPATQVLPFRVKAVEAGAEAKVQAKGSTKESKAKE